MAVAGGGESCFVLDNDKLAEYVIGALAKALQPVCGAHVFEIMV
jgi:hypothetical protein